MSELEKQVNFNLLMIGVKLNAFKEVLSDNQLEVYNNYVLDKVKILEPDIRLLLSPEQADEVLRGFLG
ncbi:hypothetical protein [Gelidibacter salicanalis]|uniref:Uncharacterized protein n=1 Tax=Gelidibacter salicanalis TaxID=291193 RepID=A0A934NK39_9FLAO|nr:hypothetical protein [Gelidibacter salicanalis]MBJ7879197.1 hypothetical protein [Gelidibacter salicanalis]